MTSIYINSSDFCLATQIKESLMDRMIDVSLIENIEGSKEANIIGNNITYVCSASWEKKIGGQQVLMDAA